MYRAFLAALAVTAANALVWTATPTDADKKAWTDAGLKAAGADDAAAYEAMKTDANKVKLYTDAMNKAQQDWEKANTKTPTPEQIKEINATALATLTDKQKTDYDAFTKLAGAAPSADQTAANTAYLAAQTKALNDWAADQSAGFAVAAAGAMLAAAALF